MNQKVPSFLKAGDVVARRYVVLRHLREEPCGGAWLAQDRTLGIDVGLKFLPRRQPRFEVIREVLRREGSLAFKLHHPNILQVVHFEEGDEGVYLVQEPFLGESLLAHLNRLERFRLPEALGLLEQVAQALAFAHHHQEVHHSFDPSHVLLEDQTIKLANFSCPRQEEGEDQQVTHLELKAYGAPEVIHGELVSPAANVFSLGVLGFRLTAGSLPYALTFDEPFPYRLESIPVDLEEIPLPLQNLLLQCLAPDPQDRLEDAGAFLAALEQRRESWRTPSSAMHFDWTPEGQRHTFGVMDFISRIWGQFRDRSKTAAEKITEGFNDLREEEKRGTPQRWLIGLAGGLLALIILIWGGRTLFKSADQTAKVPPSPSPTSSLKAAKPEVEAPLPQVEAAKPQPEVTKPQGSGPPSRSAATEPAAAPRQGAVSPPKAPPPPRPKGVEAAKPTTTSKDRYQIHVVTYLSYDEALPMKKKIKAKGLPAVVYRVEGQQKPHFVVKVGPFSDKNRAEEIARRLKTEEKLSQAPQVVKMQPAEPKTSPRKPSP